MTLSLRFVVLACVVLSCGGDDGGGAALDGGDASAAIDASTADAPGIADARPLDATVPSDAVLPDAPPPTISAGSYYTVGAVVDVALDDERHRVFLSHGATGTVTSISLVTGLARTLAPGQNAREMHFQAATNTLVVALHPTVSELARVAVFDTVTLGPRATWTLPFTAGDLVSDSAGRIHIVEEGSCGSFVTVDKDSGTAYFGNGTCQYFSRLALQPQTEDVYATSHSLPDDLMRWRWSGTRLEYMDEIPYHGDYPVCDDVRINPVTEEAYTACGNVFGRDLVWSGFVGPPWIDMAFHPGGSVVYAITDRAAAGSLQRYNASTHLPMTSIPLTAPAQRLFAGPTYLVLVRTGTDASVQTEVQVIPYGEL